MSKDRRENNKEDKNSSINKAKIQNVEEVNKKSETKEETKTMKIFIYIGVVVLFICVVYLCYHFFVQENNILINMSTDRQMDFVTLDNEEVLITTQKYVSDLGYSMRYDISSFKVFKYKDKDIYKHLEDENIIIMVEKATLPSSCQQTDENTIYSSCYVNIDDYEDDYYIYNNDIVLKIRVNTRGADNTETSIIDLIEYMIDTFEITG